MGLSGGQRTSLPDAAGQHSPLNRSTHPQLATRGSAAARNGRALARLRVEHGISQQQLAETTGKPKSEISKLLTLHDHTTEGVKALASVHEPMTPLTKHHLYNIAQLPPSEQQPFAERVRQEQLTVVQTEHIVRQRMGAKRTKVERKGLAGRQRWFKTTLADVVIHIPAAGDVG
jgi:transcriptional regulator with XRE-family HTH domain